MSLPPGAGDGAPAEALPEPPSRRVHAGITGLDPKGVRGPSSPPRGLPLVGEEGEVQPGLLALQPLGRVRGHVVIPEAAGQRRALSTVLSFCPPSDPQTGERGRRGRAVSRDARQRQVLDPQAPREKVLATPTPTSTPVIPAPVTPARQGGRGETEGRTST